MLVWSTGARTDQNLKTHKKHQTQQLGCVSCLRVGKVENGLLGFGRSPIAGNQRATVLEDEVDDTHFHTDNHTDHINKHVNTKTDTASI